MCVKKIIHSYPETFNVDPNTTYSEQDAIRLVASMKCDGSPLQKELVAIRQAHTAIHHLITLGFAEAAVELAEQLMPRAETAHLYKVAQDLCDILIAHYHFIQNKEALSKLKTIRNKFTMIISYEYDFKIIFAEAMHNYQLNIPVDIDDVQNMTDVIEKKLPKDTTRYHFSYFQSKALLLEGDDLVNLLHEAVDYFGRLHFKHYIPLRYFVHQLIKHHVKKDKYYKVTPLIENQLKIHGDGSKEWFEEAYLFAKLLLRFDDIGANDLCIKAMNHHRYVDLPSDVKEEWNVIYKETVRKMLRY